MDDNILIEELNKEIQLTLEKERLEDVKKLISKEVLSYTSKRKEITDYIEEYREKELEEYRNDEDKVAEYFDHERFIKEETFKILDRRLKELVVLEQSPYFGKVNFVDKEFEDEEYIYIGRFGMTPEGQYEPVVVDWRAPVSSLFYAGKLGEVSYKAPEGVINVDIKGKRQFVIKKGNMLGMFDSDVDVKDEILQMVLSRNASEKLKDIIMTIQAEQDNIIRQPKSKTIIVNGTAGSGKTTIALHRVAYLLYNYRESLQDKVLIIGPNSIFMEYISTVLPSLGEVGVKQNTFAEFAKGLLEIDNVLGLKEYMERILQGDNEFIEKILYKNSCKYIDELDKIVTMMDREYFDIKSVIFRGSVIVEKDEIYRMFHEYFKDMPLYRRSKKIKRILFLKIRDTRDERVREIQKEFKDAVEKMSEEQKNAEASNLDFKRRNKIREVLREAIRVKKEISLWINNPDITKVYEKLSKDAFYTLDDLAPMLYLKIKLDGFKINEEIKHVVIDEAQDYSKLQFTVIKELTRCNSMTVVGDSNQRLIPFEGNIPMLELQDIIQGADVESYRLDRSYRSTKQIMEYANHCIDDNNTIPLVRDGKEVVEAQLSNESELLDSITAVISSAEERGYESIAIVCRTLEETQKLGSLIRNKMYINVLDKENVIYNGGKVVMPSYFAKGMEFDAVIIVDNIANKDKKDDRLMYVMATRALHELYVYRTR